MGVLLQSSSVKLIVQIPILLTRTIGVYKNMLKARNHLASMPDLFWEVEEPLTVKAAQDRETTGADNAHHQGSNYHDHRVDNLGGVCGYLCFEVCLFVCQPG